MVVCPFGGEVLVVLGTKSQNKGQNKGGIIQAPAAMGRNRAGWFGW